MEVPFPARVCWRSAMFCPATPPFCPFNDMLCEVFGHFQVWCCAHMRDHVFFGCALIGHCLYLNF